MHLRHALLFLPLCILAALNAEINVSTRFEPARIALGDTSRYIVEITETDSGSMPNPERVTSLPIPGSSGLTLRNGRTSSSQQTRIVNRQAQYTITQQLIIDATASKIGSYTIPAYEFEYKGQRTEAPAATITVVERPADAAPAVDELIFLKADTPAQLYVGQTTPITLKLYLSDTVQLTGLNAFDRSADGFTMSNLPDESTESIETVNGNRYRVLSWPLTLTPITAGPQDINFQFTISAQMPDNRGGRNSPFGSGIFDNFFGRSERFNIYTQPNQIEVLPLPTDGKPKSFSGAIGDFSMQVYADSESTQVGEPIMLSLKIIGRGNFERINAPALPSSPDWRNYNPEAFFESEDPLNLKGSKRFDYVFIPEKAGTLKLPELKFAFFDPKAGKYVELFSPPLAVVVAPSLTYNNQPAPSTNVVESSPTVALTQTLSPEEALLTLDYRPQPGRNLGMSMLGNPWFHLLNGGALLLFIAASITLINRRRLRQQPDYALIRQASKDLKAALAGTKDNDPQTFYHSAQLAVRLTATKRTGRNLRSADLPTLAQVFDQMHLSEEVHRSTRELFQAADNLRFSGQSETANLQSARTQLNTILKAL